MYPKSKIAAVIFLIALLIGVFFLWKPPTSQAPGTEKQDDGILMIDDQFTDIITEEVTYHDGVKGYLARPDVPGQFPALILIHEWWGLNDNMKDFAEKFAKQGYVALAVDLYDGQVTNDPAQAVVLAGSVRANLDPAFANLKDAVSYLSSRPDVQADAIGSVGWCFGGGWSYQMAVNNLGVDASVMYYGQFDPDDDFLNMKAQILGHFGEEDTTILVDDVKEFAAVLTTLPGDHAVYVYPNAGHAFANADNEAAYNEEAAQVAWKRTLEFLKKYVR